MLKQCLIMSTMPCLLRNVESKETRELCKVLLAMHVQLPRDAFCPLQTIGLNINWLATITRT